MKKRKFISTVTILSALMLGLMGCGSSDETKENQDNEKSNEKTKLIVGASNIPHAEILEKAVPLLKEEGIDLKIKVFQDYILPNKALAEGEIDANYFQHIPYLNSQIKDNGYDFVNAGGVHIEPIGIYSKKHKKLEDLPNGAVILMRNAVADEGRILSIFEQHGLITLEKGIDKTDATMKNIVDNPKKLDFQDDFDAGLLPQIYNGGEGDAVVINANYALDAGLDPVKDPIAIESSVDNPYVNIITVQKGDEKRKEIQKLIEVLQSKPIQKYITDTYGGAVLPSEN